MDRPANLWVAHGKLTLRARREPQPIRCARHDDRFPDGRRYTAALLETKDKRSWTYGRFEVRAKLPTTPAESKGLWPAFWLRPEHGELGEIDVFEALGTGPGDAERSDFIYQTIHHDYEDDLAPQSKAWPMRQSPSSGFHTYAIVWKPTSITWLIDGDVTYRRNAQTTPWLPATFDQRFFLRLNLAVGGRWPGDPDEHTVFPADLVVDWVRVYQR